MTSVFVICYIVKGLNNCYVANSKGYLADNDVMVMVIKREDRDFSQDRRETLQRGSVVGVIICITGGGNYFMTQY